jgi:hypothetical protein
MAMKMQMLFFAVDTNLPNSPHGVTTQNNNNIDYVMALGWISTVHLDKSLEIKSRGQE